MRFYIIEYRIYDWGGEKDFTTDDSFFTPYTKQSILC